MDKKRKENCLHEVFNKYSINQGTLENFMAKQPTDSYIVLYTSSIEGLGDSTSDIDMYVITNDSDQLNNSVVTINDLEFDVEYWKVSDIKKLITSAKKLSTAPPLPSLKVLLRIKKGILFKSSTLLDVINEINLINLDNIVCSSYSQLSRSYVEDTIKLMRDNLAISAAESSLRVVWTAIAAYNAYHHNSNLKQKWMSRIFLHDDMIDKNLKNEYLTLCVYCHLNQDNLITFTKRRLHFAQNLLFETEL